MNLISARLATRAQTRQVDLSLRADAAANAVGRAIGTVWAQALRLLRSRPNFFKAQHDARHIFRLILPASITSVSTSLHRTAVWGHRSTVTALTGTLSARYLRGAAVRTMFESREPTQSDAVHLLEKRRPNNPGIIELALSLGDLNTADLADVLRDPDNTDLTDEQKKELFAQMLFPPPDIDTVTDMIQPWLNSLKAGATKPGRDPEALANIVGQGFAAGKTPNEIAKDLLPAVNDSRVAARRAARTGSMYVAHQVQQRAWDGLGDLCIGFQLHATLDQHTRPWHAARNGQVFYKEPTAGQKGMEECPDPPLEPDGTMAWNCRCHRSPVLRADPAFNDPAMQKLFADNADKLVGPDPVGYDDWFSLADERRQRTAVGSRRFQAVKGLVGKPEWGHFIDPETGHLLHKDTLAAEGEAARAARLKRVRELLAGRREAIRQVRTFGFLAA